MATSQAPVVSAPVVVITGASSGIGEGLAHGFHRRGATVVLVARRTDRLQRIVSTLNSIRPDSASYHSLDLSAEEGIEVLERILRSSRVDVLINNAGIGSFGDFADLPLARELSMLALNVVAPTRLAHAVLPQMRARGSGSLIWTSSVAALAPLPYMTTYAATKSFELTQALGLWQELKASGVHVLAICPGPTDTEFSGVARVPGTVTGLTRDTVQRVVEDSLRALDRRAPIVIPGWGSWFLALLARIVPILWTVRVTAFLLRGPLRKSRVQRD